MQTEIEPQVTSDRRERFRKYMQALNPTAPAELVINRGLAIQDLHGSLYRKLATRTDLDPSSQQLIVGGIGSGKTTELLLAERWLREKAGWVCLYIDISSETDLSGLNSGALLAGFGVHLSRKFRSLGFENSLSDKEMAELENLKLELRRFAFGKTETVFVRDDDGDEGEYDPALQYGQYISRKTAGKLQPPFPPLQRDVKEIKESLEFFVNTIKAQPSDIVVLFDGLDRLPTPEKFWSVADQDFRVFRELGVAVVAAAPLAILYGSGRSIVEHFDRVHHIPAVETGSGKTDKLAAVLMQRGVGSLASRTEIDKTVKASGGVLRDLITLARDAGEMAYLDGSDSVKAQHVKAATKQLGGGYLRGLGALQLRILRRLAKDRSIDIFSDAAIELLATRRVLEYSATDFRVHPALEPLIRMKQQNV